MTGDIPSELGGLVELEHLDLSFMILSGAIPPELGDLPRLKELFILSNDLSGEIPPKLGNLSELEQLLLSGNDLSGPIPAELGALSKLSELWLYENGLTGSIPPEFEGLTSVRVLDLHDNGLSGSIPWELGELSNLLRLALSDNSFGGCIRPSLRNISSNDLADLGLPDCAQDGRVPTPGGLSVTLLSGTFTIGWDAVTGAAEYEAQYRVSGSVDGWTALPATTGTSATYSPSGGPACGTTYEFSVRSYGDGTTYVAGWSAESATETVTTDICNDAPVFDAAMYEFMVSEVASVDDVVGTVSATDPDAGDTVSYAIVSGNGDGKFAIGDGTGDVKVAAALDYETAPSYTLTVEASDGRGGSVTIDVGIDVEDVIEDVPPAPGGLSVTLSSGTFTMGWNAVTGATEYEAQHQVSGSAEGWTSLPATTGTSATYSPAGGPTCGTTYEFRVRSYGNGTTYLAGWGPESALESVTTEACNLDPGFDAPSYEFTVSEGAPVSRVVGTVSATDPNTGDTVSYAIASGNGEGKFAIGDMTGAITLARRLDYETTSSYTLTVEASDGRGGVATVDVDIEVTNVAEGPPPIPDGLDATLSGGTFTITWNPVTGVSHYAVQQLIVGVHSSWVNVDSSIREARYEHTPAGGVQCGGVEYRFRVWPFGDGVTYLATWGHPQSSDFVAVTTDACNQVPEFDPTTYDFSIREDASVDDVVDTVSATDPDAGDTVSYAITSGNGDGKFAIDDETGEIKVAMELDYETTSSYTLTVEASDGRGGSATVDVDITVIDVAEDLPLAPGGLGVTLLSGTFTISWDAVTGATEYEAQHRVSGSSDGWTALPTTTGTSATYSPTDGPLCGTTYEFRVRSYGDGTTYAADWGVESSVEPVTTEACNQVPEFDPTTYDFSIREDASVDDVVDTVSATDPDADDTVSYAITSGNGEGKFAIDDETGEIKVAMELDYETTSSYTLTVEASDGRGGSATVDVDITVIDVAEDLPPAPSGLGVTLLSGTFTISWDAVTGAAEYEAQHRVSGSSDGWTALPTTTGTSATYSPTDGPLCGATYEFRVRSYGDGTTYAADWGVESSVEPVTTEACDRAPEFTKSLYSFTIAETAATGASVGTVEATDPDAGDTVSYSIATGNDDGKFAIDAGTGAITVAGALDPDTTAYYALTVEASDSRGRAAAARLGIAVLLTECSNGTVVPNPSSNPGLVRDCSMLLAARDTLAGDANLNWRVNARIHSWQGVTVWESGTHHVRVVMLTGLSLTGSIPASLGGLADVRRIDLDDNMLIGEIPPELGNLSKLELLFLHYNRLTGGIPAELNNLGNLKSLYLADNMLTGGIPVGLGGLSRLTQLILDGNQLGGEIPEQLGNLARLKHLYLRDNGLTGAIPSTLEGLNNLTHLYIEGNSFTGCIPSGLQDTDNNDLDALGLSYCASNSE